MRTQQVVNEIISQAKIVLSERQQYIAKLQQSTIVTEAELQTAYEQFFAVENVLYALRFQGLLTLFSQNILCDFLVRNGYYFNYNSLHFTEIIFNSPDFDTVQ